MDTAQISIYTNVFHRLSVKSPLQLAKELSETAQAYGCYERNLREPEWKNNTNLRLLLAFGVVGINLSYEIQRGKQKSIDRPVSETLHNTFLL